MCDEVKLDTCDVLEIVRVSPVDGHSAKILQTRDVLSMLEAMTRHPRGQGKSNYSIIRML